MTSIQGRYGVVTVNMPRRIFPILLIIRDKALSDGTIHVWLNDGKASMQ